MPIRKQSITSNVIYHILNRGVDKRMIFIDDNDHFRFIDNLYHFNNKNFNKGLHFRLYKKELTVPDGCGEREELVDVLSFCLMPNHYHLLVKSRDDSGLINFIKRINQGYSQYFNRKNSRQGALFESRYKIVPIINESHFTHIPYYIHFNPLDLIGSGWRKSEVGDVDAELRFMDSYHWSSHLDYSGVRNFPSVTSREFLLDHFGGPDGYKKSIRDWLISRRNFEWMKGMTLE